MHVCVLYVCIYVCVCVFPFQAQVLFFLVIMVSFVNYFVGTIIPATPEKQAKGFFSYKGDSLVTDLKASHQGFSNFFFTCSVKLYN